MAPGRTVVVGIDGSEGGRSALRWAVDFAGSIGAEIRGVASWSYPASAALPGGPILRSPDEMDAETAHMALEELTAASPQPVHEHQISVDRGAAARAILAAVQPTTEIVVVGKRGLGGVEGRLLGSVSRRVAELSPVPVAVIPTGADECAGPIVVGVDGSHAARVARDWAISIAQRLGRDLVVVHGVAGLPAELPPSAIDRFIDSGKELAASHAEVVTASGVTVSIVVEVVDPRLLLRRAADDVDAAMIVIGATGEGPAAGILVGSVVGHIVQQAERPVVVVNERA